MRVTIKDLIDFLQNYGHHTPCFLDKNGWESSAKTPHDAIKYSGLFTFVDPAKLDGSSDEPYLIINN